MSATLGGLLKDYRLQKNLSQMEIAFALGWKEPSRLSRIEQGKVSNPPRELLDRIMEVMELKEEEKNHLLLVGNYLPTKEEIGRAQKQTDLLVKSWPYPASVMDFSWRVIHVNKPLESAYQVGHQKYVKESKDYPSLLEIFFDPHFPQNKHLRGKRLQKWHGFLSQLLIHFIYAQRTRTREKWYVNLIKKLMDDTLFQKLWQEALKSKETEFVTNFAKKTLIHPDDPKKELNLYLFAVPVLRDRRFDVTLFVPVDFEAYSYFHKGSN